MTFDPFDPSTYREKDPDPAQYEDLLVFLRKLREDAEEWSKWNGLCRYLEGNRPDKAFKQLLASDPDFKALFEWLIASDGRRERAAVELRAHLRNVQCPRCSHIMDRDDPQPLGAFDWVAFAEVEQRASTL